jgi:hypothetical protein
VYRQGVDFMLIFLFLFSFCGQDVDHTKFIEKYGLQMTLLSDVGGAIRKKYEVRTAYGQPTAGGVDACMALNLHSFYLRPSFGYHTGVTLHSTVLIQQ